MRTEPGARWLRCDLHIHTPFDDSKKFGEDVRGAIDALKKEKPQRLAAIAERFVESCRAAAGGSGVDLVALTDHNSIEGYRRLMPFFAAIAQQARDQNKPMPAILPGVEFSVGGERPIHFLAIFAANAQPEDIERAVQFIFGPRELFDPKTGTPRATGESINQFLDQVYKYCRPPTGERIMQFVLLPAHADGDRGVGRETGAGNRVVATTLWDEMKGHLRQWAVSRTDWNGFETSRPFSELPQAFRDLLLRWAAARRGEDWDTLGEAQKQRHREQKHWALVECSDPHKYEAIGARYTWLKMEAPDIEGIRLALLDPESRLRRMSEGPPAHAYPRISRIGVRKTDSFDDFGITINPCLTTMIGGRGSGKSTVIEYVRYALDRNRPEDFSADDEDRTHKAVGALLAQKAARDFGESGGTLLPNHEIEVDLTVAGRAYRVRRTAGGTQVVPDPDSPGAAPAPLDVRTLILPRILSQRQIARIARDPAAQRCELDALVGPEHIREFEKRHRELLDELTRLQMTRTRLRDKAKAMPSRETELQKVSDQIFFLEEGGRKETFDRFQAYQAEEHWLADVRRQVEAASTAVTEQADATAAVGKRLAVPPAGPTGTWTASVADRVRSALDHTASLLREQASALRNLVQTVDNEQVLEWRPGFEEARREYDELRGEMQSKGVEFAQHEKLLQQRVLLERELSTLVHKFGNVFCYAATGSAGAWWSSFRISAARSSLVNRPPFERRRDALVIGLERQQPVLNLFEGPEVIGREGLALDDREVDFELVEPTRMNRPVDGDQIGKRGLKTLNAGGAPMRRPVVDDPEDAPRLAIRRLGHHLRHQAVERRDARRRFAPAEECGAMDVERREVGPSAAPRVFVFDVHRVPRAGWRRRMSAEARLDARFFVGTEHEVVSGQPRPLPAARVQIQNTSGFPGKVWVAREDPGAVLPRPDRVFMQPSPDGLVADGGHDAVALDLPDNVRRAQAREGHAERGRQFTREGLDLDDDFWGKKPGGDPGGGAPPGPVGVHGRSACARD